MDRIQYGQSATKKWEKITQIFYFGYITATSECNP